MKLVNWFKSNLGGIIFGAVVVGLIAGIMWPGRVAKLSNGDEVAAKTKNKTYTADQIYKSLKEVNGLTVLLNMVDDDITLDKYGKEVDKEAKENAQKEAEQYYKEYETYYGYTKEQFLQSNGFSSEEQFLNTLVREYKLSKYYDEYTESLVDEADMRKYYDDNNFGDKTVVIYSSTTDENMIKDIQKELKSGTKTSKIKSKYNKAVVNEVTITLSDINSYSSTIINAIKGIEKTGVSNVLTDDTYGYVVVYVSETKAAKKYNEIKDDVRSILAKEIQAKDQTLYIKAVSQLREEYGFKITDSDINKYYKNFLAMYTNNQQQSNEEVEQNLEVE